MTAPPPLLDVDVEVRRRSLTVAAAFELAPGERAALFGPSGAGKTTILESIAGLVALRRGTVRVAGLLVAGRARRETPAPPRRRAIALVRQPTALFPHLTVAQNIAYGAPRSAQLAPLLERLGVSGLASARAAALSGGQRQRVALGRALASEFKVLLLDEPLSAVDGVARIELRRLAAESAAEREAAALLVTHELTEAQGFGQRVAIIDAGRVLELGDGFELVRHPSRRRVAELVGYGGFVPAPGGPGSWYALHPERVVAGEAPERGLVLRGRVAAVAPFGPRYECEVVLETGDVFRVRLDEPLLPGTEHLFTALDPPIVAA